MKKKEEKSKKNLEKINTAKDKDDGLNTNSNRNQKYHNEKHKDNHKEEYQKENDKERQNLSSKQNQKVSQKDDQKDYTKQYQKDKDEKKDNKKDNNENENQKENQKDNQKGNKGNKGGRKDNRQSKKNQTKIIDFYSEMTENYEGNEDPEVNQEEELRPRNTGKKQNKIEAKSDTEKDFKLPGLIDKIDIKSLEKTNQMKKERYFGNIEYKYKITNKSEDRIEELRTQMNFRLKEGNGECIYVIGVKDDGTPEGISEDDMRESLKTLEIIAKKLDAELNIFYWGQGKAENSFICQISGTKKMEEQNKYFPKKVIKIGLLGESDTGKSTLV